MTIPAYVFGSISFKLILETNADSQFGTLPRVITSLSTKKRNNGDRRAISKTQVKLNVLENVLSSLKYEEKAQKLAL